MSINPKKKVLFLITKANWGGAQRYVYDLATHLDPAKFEVKVLVGGQGQLTEMLAHQHIPYLSLPSLSNDLKPKLIFKTMTDIYRLLKAERPDILHVNSSVAGLIGTFVGRLARVPKIIFTAHGWAFNEDRPWWQRKIFLFLHWFNVLLSDRTIAVSKAIVDQLPSFGIESKMKVLHPGRTIGVMYNKEEARNQLCEIFPILEKIRSEVWIGTIAELHPIKRQHLLIESLAAMQTEFPKARLVIIGEGKERENLENLITKYNLHESVFLLGAVSEAARLIKAFDVFALTSKSEAYGYVLHEAGLAELPVVATNVGGIPEIVENGVSGLLVPPNNSLALTGALKNLLNNKELRDKLALNLYNEMKERTIEKMTRATEVLYTL